MSGRHAGVQVLFREKCGTPCYYVHCYAHRLNLVLVDACSNIDSVNNVIGLMEAVYSFFSASVRRHDAFKESQTARDLPVLELPQQSDTRWVCKHRAVKVFTTRFESILSTLNGLSGGGNAPKERVEAKGLLMQLSSVDVLFTLHLLDSVLPIINSLSEYLQSKAADAAKSLILVDATKQLLSQMRDDNQFEGLLAKVQVVAASNGIEAHPREPRQRRLP
jgi:hypothetical protein